MTNVRYGFTLILGVCANFNNLCMAKGASVPKFTPFPSLGQKFLKYLMYNYISLVSHSTQTPHRRKRNCAIPGIARGRGGGEDPPQTTPPKYPYSRIQPFENTRIYVICDLFNFTVLNNLERTTLSIYDYICWVFNNQIIE